MWVRWKTVPHSWSAVAETTLAEFSSCSWQNVVCSGNGPQPASGICCRSQKLCSKCQQHRFTSLKTCTWRSRSFSESNVFPQCGHSYVPWQSRPWSLFDFSRCVFSSLSSVKPSEQCLQVYGFGFLPVSPVWTLTWCFRVQEKINALSHT